MTDYIEREAAIKLFNFAVLDCLGMEPTIRAGDIIKALESVSAADVRPVVRGKWEQKEVFEAKGHVDELQSAFCPVCQRYHTTPYSYYFTEYNFCPNCGADMREPPKEEAT